MLTLERVYGIAIDVGSTTIAAPYPDTREEILDLHFRHLVEPVRFRPMIERLYAAEERRLGAAFSEREFHDRLLRCGAIQFPLVRKLFGYGEATSPVR
mgnify:CR=1 FL=1